MSSEHWPSFSALFSDGRFSGFLVIGMARQEGRIVVIPKQRPLLREPFHYAFGVWAQNLLKEGTNK